MSIALMILLGAVGSSLGGRVTIISLILILTLSVAIYTVSHVNEPIIRTISKYINKTLTTVLVIVLLIMCILIPVILAVWKLNFILLKMESVSKSTNSVFGALILGSIGYFIGYISSNIYIHCAAISGALIFLISAQAKHLRHPKNSNNQKGGNSRRKRNQNQKDSTYMDY